MSDGMNLAQADRMLAIVPMFHAMSWGLPYAALWWVRHWSCRTGFCSPKRCGDDLADAANHRRGGPDDLAGPAESSDGASDGHIVPA